MTVFVQSANSPREGEALVITLGVTSGTQAGEFYYSYEFHDDSSMYAERLSGGYVSYDGSHVPVVTLRGIDPPTAGGITYSVNFYSGSVTVDPARSTVNGYASDNDPPEYTVSVTGDLWTNLARTGSATAAAAAQLQQLGSAPPRQVIAALEPSLLATTTVAEMSYQFFTGKTPSEAGLDYLVKPSANPNSLNSPYYTDFNLENRYFNFASNLGLVGEGAAKFQSDYGSLPYHDAIVKMYTQIIGTPPASAIAAIEASLGYFQAVAHERLAGAPLEIATKAVIVGYVLEEAAKANVGVYARSLENFYLDLADGTAKHNVNLVGAYGPGTVLDAHS